MKITDDLIRRCPALEPSLSGILAAYHIIKSCFSSGGKLLICGSGGSFADAEHISGELGKGFLMKRPLPEPAREKLSALGADGEYLAETLQMGLPAIPLGLNALSTAAANDLGGGTIFAQQVMALGRPGDVLLGISTSGNARNVLLAALTAKAIGMRAIAMTGQGGGKLAGAADALIAVEETETYRVQELHLPAYHALCAMLEEAFFPI
jgi:D-sedoheptulose 7-phosphate isomerase